MGRGSGEQAASGDFARVLGAGRSGAGPEGRWDAERPSPAARKRLEAVKREIDAGQDTAAQALLDNHADKLDRPLLAELAEHLDAARARLPESLHIDSDTVRAWAESWVADYLGDPETDLERVRLEDFGEGASAVEALSLEAFSAPGVLRGVGGLGVPEVIVYALESSYENPVMVAIRPASAPDWQVTSLTMDGNRLADNQWERRGPDVLVEVLSTLVAKAGSLLPALERAMAERADG